VAGLHRFQELADPGAGPHGAAAGQAEEFGGGREIAPEFMFEPDRPSCSTRLIPRYVEAKVFHGLLESSASEHAADSAP
jgi:F0F1-type ATP synthase gamma subunit